MKIYLDVCCLNRPFDDQANDIIRIESEAVITILSRCLDEWILVGSEVIDYEISKIPDEERRKKVEILALSSKEKITVDDEIVERAIEIENIKLNPIDALHIACAEKSADVMLTTDNEIIKKVKKNKSRFKIEVENPVKWLLKVMESEKG